MKILLIEDDHIIASFITKGLKEAAFATDHFDNGQQGLSAALSAPYDLAIIDLMLPGRDGLSIIAEIRKAGVDLPVIILSAKRSVEDRIQGLQHGGDDYLIKPFSFSELLARVEALLRRANHQTEPSSLSLHDLSMDLLARTVTRAGQKITLQPKEFALLEYLIRNTGRVVSKTMIMERVWNYDFDPGTNVVEARISKLREKIDKDFSHPLIHTIRGLGYVLKVDHD
jgi:two-component system OmpR family response regulator